MSRFFVAVFLVGRASSRFGIWSLVGSGRVCVLRRSFFAALITARAVLIARICSSGGSEGSGGFLFRAIARSIVVLMLMIDC